MPNRNYEAGRRLEYDIMKDLKEQGYHTIRASGSHGIYDVAAFRTDRKVQLIQCKLVSGQAEANRLKNTFRNETLGSDFYHQVLAVKIRGSKNIDYTVV